MEKLFTRLTIKRVSDAHQLVASHDRGSTYWYCTCGAFIDFKENMPEHLESVWSKTKADAYLLKNGSVKV